MMLHITDSNYAEVVAKGLPIVLDFSATWCGPCKKIAPIMDELEAAYEGKVIIGKCDVDECEELSMQFGIRNVPTVLYIKDGEIKDKQVGAAAKNVLEEKLQSIL
ncbi:MAG: thioredoxin [Bacteroidaceae bacterium]|nr:thioredoxin [Bacteroidaceae bacterium]